MLREVEEKVAEKEKEVGEKGETEVEKDIKYYLFFLYNYIANYN